MRFYGMRWLAVLALLALPARAEDCFSGLPKRLSYDNGSYVTIIQRHGEDFTYEAPYPGGNNVVSKTRLGLFPRDSRLPSRYFEYRWDDRLPQLADLVPGYRFDVAGQMAAGKDEPRAYRISGEVLGREEVKIGDCSYPVLAIARVTYVNGAQVSTDTLRFSPEMMVVLWTDGSDAAGKRFSQHTVRLE